MVAVELLVPATACELDEVGVDYGDAVAVVELGSVVRMVLALEEVSDALGDATDSLSESMQAEAEALISDTV